MSKPKIEYFKLEDFSSSNYINVNTAEISLSRESAAELANEKLNALIESWPVVYGWGQRNLWSVQSHAEGDKRTTHKARLAFIEEIDKEPCKHEPRETYQGVQGKMQKMYGSKCTICGIELVPQWQEKK